MRPSKKKEAVLKVPAETKPAEKVQAPLTEAEIFRLQKRQLELMKMQLELVEGLPHLYGFKWYKWAREFFESTNRENFLCAANQISKSSTQIRKAIHWATEKSLWPKLWPSLGPGQAPNQFWYFYPTIDVAQTEFETKWEPIFMPKGKYKDDPIYGWNAVYDKGNIKKIEFNSGVTIYFKTYSQKVKDLQSGTVYAVHCDEELPVELVPELQARLNSSDGYFHMVFTATLGQLYWEQTMEPANKTDERYPNAWKRTVSLYDCLEYEDGTPSHWTPEKIKRVIAKCPTDSDVQRRVFGRFVKSEGLMFPSFDYDRNTVDYHPPPSHWLHFSGVDPGTGGEKAHPAAIVFIAVSPDFKHARVWRAWRGDKISTASPDIYQKYRELRGKLSMMAQKYDWASREFFLHVSAKGEAFSPADKDHVSGYSLLNTLFKSGMLKVMRGDPETDKLIGEIRTLASTGDKRRAQDDLCDAMRYACNAVPWDFSDIEDKDAPQETFQEIKGLKDKSPAEQRRDWFMGHEATKEESIQDELDFWNEHLES
jgi:hypothetical protein